MRRAANRNIRPVVVRPKKRNPRCSATEAHGNRCPRQGKMEFLGTWVCGQHLNGFGR